MNEYVHAVYLSFGTDFIFSAWHSYVGSIDHLHLSVLYPNCIWAVVQFTSVCAFNHDEKPVSISALSVVVQCATKPSNAKNADFWTLTLPKFPPLG